MYGIHSLMIVIEHGIDYSYLGLGITCSSTFLNNNLFDKSPYASQFLFCIAKGLATFRLGGVISVQKVQF